MRKNMKENSLYLECYSGISGDMTVAALLDLGADQNILLKGLKSLKVNGYKIEIGRRNKSSINACDFNVILENTPAYEMGHSDDHEHPHDHAYSHEHEHSHAQEHSHLHSIDATIASSMPVLNNSVHLILGHHEHRNLSEINHIIEASDITENAKIIAKRIFHIIAVAESKAHAKPIEEVHFHEVGAVDSIVDIVAAAICLDNLNIKKVIVSELYEGTGTIECQHGMIPIPAPAVVNISAAYQLPLHITGIKGELVTPTGAAIVAAIKTDDELPNEMKILKIGLGAGKRSNPGSSGILRAMLIEDINATPPCSDKVWVLEANLDDCSGEALSYAMELLLQNGAKDVYYTPIYMKKNRPAYLLGVICKEEDVSKLEGIIFTHTTTIGIRKSQSIRSILSRVQETVTTAYGDAIVKVCTYKDQTYAYPEYESIKLLCDKTGLDYHTMYHEVQNAYQK